MSYALTIGFITYGKSTAKYLPYFLSSLKDQTFKDFSILVFDNTEEADNDNLRYLNGLAGAPQLSVAQSRCLTVPQYRGTVKHLEIMRADKNIGFAAAYNRLINRAKELGAEYFLALNLDMILEPDAIEKMAKALAEDESLGSVCPKILKWDFIKMIQSQSSGRTVPQYCGTVRPLAENCIETRPDEENFLPSFSSGGAASAATATGENRGKTNIIDSCGIILKPGLRFFDLGQGEIDKGQYDNAEILGPSGAAAMYRMSALENVETPPFARGEGGDQKTAIFDELMFMYKEDCDLAYRLHLAGYKCKLIADAVVYHDRTAYGKGEGDLQVALNRKNKSRQVKKWAFLHQQIIFIKYWHLQSFWNKMAIAWFEIKMIVFILLFEQYLLREFWRLWKICSIIKRYKK